jgi:hypothetical protein
MNDASKGSPKGGQASGKLAEIFGADLRSLATFRIVLGVLVLADLAIRSADIVAHYTDAGVMPRVALEPPDLRLFPQAVPMMSPWTFSLNTLSGGLLLQALIFVVGAVAAVALLIGYRTRVSSVVVWVVLLSIQQRNPLILTSGDILLRMLLFWAMFLPLGAIWSVDRLRGAVPVRLSMRYFSLATVALFLQIAFIYWFTALLKTGPEWRTDFSALYYALSLDQVTRPFGQFLLDFPTLLTVMTAATILLEAVGPFLLFSPFFTGPVRTAAILAFMSLHFGIFLAMDIGLFPFISAFCMVCFLPSWFWDEVVPKLRAALPGGLEAIKRRLQAHLGRLRVAPTGEATDPTTLKATFASDLLAVLFLVMVLFWNLTTVVPVAMPTGAAPLSFFLGLDQKWNMFAPRPTVDDGWYVIPGNLQNGERVGLMPILRGEFDPPKGVSWEKPRVVTYETNVRWSKYLEFVGSAEHADQRPHFGNYLCRAWNERHTGGERLERLQIFYMRESTLPDYRPSTIEMVRLWAHDCAS